jgi:serine phosphatase RsbU (regulator of sigma subunit)
MADVSSKGSLGALHGEMVRNVFRGAVAADTAPSAVVALMNRVRFDVPRRDLQGTFASAFVARVSGNRDELAYASAGHDVALVFDGLEHRHLEPTGPILGIFCDVEWVDRTVQFGPDSLLVLATDGVTETRCAVEPSFEFGTSGIVQSVIRSTAHSKSIAEDISQSVDGFGNSFYRDDATVAVLQRYSQGRIVEPT